MLKSRFPMTTWAMGQLGQQLRLSSPIGPMVLLGRRANSPMPLHLTSLTGTCSERRQQQVSGHWPYRAWKPADRPPREVSPTSQ